MRRNEAVMLYPGISDNSEFHIRFFEAEISFGHREYFEHKHSDFEISLVLSGSGIYRLGDTVCPFSEGDVFVFGTNVVHCITDTSSCTPVRIATIQFEPRLIWSPFSGLVSQDHLGLFNGKCEKLGGGTLADLIADKLIMIKNEAIAKEAGHEIMVKAYLCEIIGSLVRDGEKKLHGISSETKRDSLICMDRAMAYVNAHLGEKLTLDRIAKEAGFSRTYFSALFTSLNGLSPWEYITIKRIEKSKELLRTTSLPVISISSLCGFSNLSNFNRMFARIAGVSPSAYRKSSKK